MNPSPKICPRCQTPIPADAPGELCPGCLLLEAVAPAETAGGVFGSTPTLEEVAAAFPDLEILEMIGHGGMGVVFKARQTRLGRLIALKILPPGLAGQPGFVERFNREARALARLNHPNIVAVYDFGESAGFCYLLMEFVTGVNLRQAMRAGVKPEQALTLVPQICEALQFAHDHGVLHRDIKPENILLDTAGKPKLADFGIAKLADDKASSAGLTLSGAALGTAAYMAPEQIEKPGTVDHRADIYSLGVVLYEMLTGELPLGRFAAPSEKSGVAQGVDEVVMRALEKERERRQQTATQMKTEVEYANTAAGSGGRAGDEEWMLRCPACGKARRLSEAGGVRLGAASIGKRTFGKCSHCGFQGMLDVITARELRTVPYTPDPVAARQRAFSSGKWPLSKISLVLALLASPLAIIVTLLAMPALQKNGFSVYSSVALSVGLGLLLLVCVWLFFAGLIGVFRLLIRSGAPVWLAGSAVAFAMLLFPLAVILWMIPGRAPGMPRPQPTYSGDSVADSHFNRKPNERPPRRPRPSVQGGGGSATSPAQQALLDEAVRLAKEQFQAAKLRHAAGFSSTEELEDAERALAVAEARGDSLKILEVKVQHAEKALQRGQARHEAKVESTETVRQLELELNRLRLELENARARSGAKRGAVNEGSLPDVGASSKDRPNRPGATGEDSQAKALQDEAIRLAKEQLAKVKVRYEGGFASVEEYGNAQRDLAVAEARGDEKKALEAQIEFAEKALGIEQQRFESGVTTKAEVEKIKLQINGYRQQLLKLQPEAPAPNKVPLEQKPEARAAQVEDEIRLAQVQLQEAKQQLDAGVYTMLDVAFAQRNLAIAEAAGDETKILEAKITYATQLLVDKTLRQNAGVVLPSEVTAVEVELGKYQRDLEQLRNGKKDGER